MTYFTAPHGGAVFACGSVAFAQSLPVNNFRNSASRVLANVVEAFAGAAKLPGLAWVNEEKQWA